ncbi:DMT family transporter [Ralstonia syzygii]|uniref:EamA domain-containing protein n=1 Tax=Ralstonia syzygii R24 TaxID=907261 RepID=G3A1B4_9RALS|nr:DMT family transporter [Ralstonia syzygii]CCA85002.1 conserved membrane hypothetical protein, DUF6 domain [Ralstonia syzygii R24]
MTQAHTKPASLPVVSLQEERIGRLYMVGAMVIAGTIGFFVLLSGQSPFNVVFFRCAIGAVGLGLYCWWRGFFRSVSMSRGEALNLVLGALTLVFNWYFLFTAYSLTSIGITTVVYNFQPFLLLLASFVFRRERLGASAIAWLLMAFAGLVVLAEPTAPHVGNAYLLGVGSALTAAALYAATTLLTKKLSATMRPEVIAVCHMAIGAGVFVLLADFSHLPQLPHQVFAVLALGLFHTTFMYVLLYGAFQKASTASLAIFGFIYPVVAVVVDYLAYGKVMNPAQLVGGVLILAAAGAYAKGLKLPLLDRRGASRI